MSTSRFAIRVETLINLSSLLWRSTPSVWREMARGLHAARDARPSALSLRSARVRCACRAGLPGGPVSWQGPASDCGRLPLSARSPGHVPSAPLLELACVSTTTFSFLNPTARRSAGRDRLARLDGCPQRLEFLVRLRDHALRVAELPACAEGTVSSRASRDGLRCTPGCSSPAIL